MVIVTTFMGLFDSFFMSNEQKQAKLFFENGKIALILPNYAAAQEWFEKAMLLDPKYKTNAEVWYYLGTGHEEYGRYADAIDAYSKAEEFGDKTRAKEKREALEKKISKKM
jgi:tetratricopeptide (TPR) repeat protein